MFISVLMLALNFAVTKLYQKKCGASPYPALRFNVFLGLFSSFIFFALSGFKIEVTIFSAIMAPLLAALVVSYILIGFYIMEKETVAIYTIFLMTGGMIVPYIWGLLFLNETFSILRTVGLIVIACGVFVAHSSNSRISYKTVLLCILVFLLNGFVSVVSKEHQISSASIPTTHFMTLNSLAKTFLSALALVFVKKNQTSTVKLSWPLIAIIFAAALFSGVSSMLQLIGAKNLPATVLYPIISGGAIIFTAFAGRIFFKEKITMRLACGIILCFIGTLTFL